MEKKSEKKLPKHLESYALKSLPLHPLLKTKAARVDILFKETVPGPSSFFFLPPFRQERRRGKRKKKNEKKLPKIFGRYALKFLPLHPLSEKNSNRETSDL